MLKMRAGCVAYIPMHWWHQVLLLCVVLVLSPALKVSP